MKIDMNAVQISFLAEGLRHQLAGIPANVSDATLVSQIEDCEDIKELEEKFGYEPCDYEMSLDDIYSSGESMADSFKLALERALKQTPQVNQPQEGMNLVDLLLEWEDYGTEVDGSYFIRYSGGLSALDEEELSEARKEPSIIVMELYDEASDEKWEFSYSDLIEATFNESDETWTVDGTSLKFSSIS